MNIILANSIMAILVPGVIAPTLQEALALKSDMANKLPPKAFGEKTKAKIITDDLQKKQKGGFETIKKEQVKAYKKIIAQYNAKQILEKLYRLG